MKKFISVEDVRLPHLTLSQSIDEMIDCALAYKSNPLKDSAMGANKRMDLLFLNPSLRTRMSTQVAAEQLGMKPIVFNIGTEGWTWEFEDGAIMNGNTVSILRMLCLY